MYLTTKAFWANAAERAVKTVAQAALATLGAGALDILHVSWLPVVGVALGAGVLSLLTSVASGTAPALTASTSTATPAASTSSVEGSGDPVYVQKLPPVQRDGDGGTAG